MTAEAGSVLYRPEGHRHSDKFLNTRGRTFGLDLVEGVKEFPSEPVSLRTPQVGRLTSQLYREFRRNDECSSLAVEGLLLLLQAEVGRSIFRASRSIPKWLRTVEEQLAVEYLTPSSLAEMAKSANVHPVHLSREFQKHFGCTIGQHIRKLRVEHGRRSLASSEISLGEVSLDAGFCDQAHFTRAFQEFTGMTPGEYRKDEGGNVMG
jgi:AraC-like DNA-binding protein